MVTVLIPEIVPRKRYHEILHNQRGRLLAAVLRVRGDVIVATLPFRCTTDGWVTTQHAHGERILTAPAPVTARSQPA